MATDSLTDLIGGLILLPMMLVLCRMPASRERRRWLALFGLLAGSCLVGFAAHYYFEPRSRFWFNLIWIALYPLLYQTVGAFFLLARQIATGGAHPRRRETMAVCVMSTAFALISIALLWAAETQLDIRLFVCFAAVLGVLSFAQLAPVAFRRHDAGAAYLFLALAPLLAAVYVQIERTAVIHVIWAFNYNAIAHVFVILAEFVFFAAAIRRLRGTPRA